MVFLEMSSISKKQIWNSRKWMEHSLKQPMTSLFSRPYVPIFKIDVGYFKQEIYIYI